VTMSLGYRAAVADMLWAHVLVSQGLHTFEKRRFENLTRLYDAINELDPTWRSPYLFADALITFQAADTPYDEVVKAREILERGAKHRPYDPDIWLNLGQFVAFVAPNSYLEPDHPDEAKQWRVEGAQMLAKAADLGAGDQSYVSWQAIGGANILAQAGQREAAIRFLERTLAVTDDDELRRYVAQRLGQLKDERAVEARARFDKAFRELALRGLPFINRTTALVLGPPRSPAACAGQGHDDDPACAPSWLEWTRRTERIIAATAERP